MLKIFTLKIFDKSILLGFRILILGFSLRKQWPAGYAGKVPRPRMFRGVKNLAICWKHRVYQNTHSWCVKISDRGQPAGKTNKEKAMKKSIKRIICGNCHWEGEFAECKITPWQFFTWFLFHRCPECESVLVSHNKEDPKNLEVWKDRAIVMQYC